MDHFFKSVDYIAGERFLAKALARKRGRSFGQELYISFNKYAFSLIRQKIKLFETTLSN